MFAGGDFLLRRLLSASPINQVQTSGWDASTLLAPSTGVFTPNSGILSNGIFGINQSGDSLLQDYNATLQLVQLQMLLNQQQQPNLELLVAAMALQQQQIQLPPKLSPDIKKHFFDGEQVQEKFTILDHLLSTQNELSEPNKISPMSRTDSGLTPPIDLVHKQEAQEKVEGKKRSWKMI
uniref:Uncharacterized protein n=1 Tax=Ditylenchus dipsaci TaxID=166011 RepID=A0A915EUK9_9BILA